MAGGIYLLGGAVGLIAVGAIGFVGVNGLTLTGGRSDLSVGRSASMQPISEGTRPRSFRAVSKLARLSQRRQRFLLYNAYSIALIVLGLLLAESPAPP